MFKLVVLTVLLAVAAAHPGHHKSAVVYTAPIVREHSFAKVGTIVKSVPSAVSHQSSTIVHGGSHIVQPIVAPVVKTYTAPIVHTSYHASPVIKTVSTPIIKTVSTPIIKTYTASAPSLFTYSAASVDPWKYASSW